MLFTFMVPSKVVFGVGAAASTGEELKALGLKKVLLVTDQGVVKSGLLQPVENSIRNSEIDCVVFDQVEPNPTVTLVENGLAFLKENGCDGLVAVGGGSPIDTAKGIAVMATNPGKISDYAGFDKVKVRPLPVVSIPTTSGTGSEVTLFAVITDEATKFKMSIGGKLVCSTVAIVDPKMTETVPPFVTATTGIDALTHAIESSLSLLSTPYTEAIALAAVSLVGQSLRQAWANGSNICARTRMSLASMMAGMAFTNTKLGLVHAMANTYGGYFPSPHGAVNAILLPYCMKYNLPSNPYMFSKIAAALGENVSGLNEIDAAERALIAVDRLIADVKIPTSLRVYGMDEGLIGKMAKESFATANAQVNCRKVTIEEIENLYREASR